MTRKARGLARGGALQPGGQLGGTLVLPDPDLGLKTGLQVGLIAGFTTGCPGPEGLSQNIDIGLDLSWMASKSEGGFCLFNVERQPARQRYHMPVPALAPTPRVSSISPLGPRYQREFLDLWSSQTTGWTTIHSRRHNQSRYCTV